MQPGNKERASLPELIDLSLGHPGMELLPLGDFRRMASRAFSTAEPMLLQYGPKQGELRFREALAGMLSSSLGVPTNPDSLFITSGASQALDLVCTVLGSPGDVVLVEEPTYFLALRIFASRGLRVKGIPVDEDGLVVEALEEALRESRPAFLYTIPTYQNPSGVTLSGPRRRRLVEISHEYELLVVADEVYHLLDFGTPPPAPMSDYDPGGNVVAINSFSKILGPGLRLGWIQANPLLVSKFVTSALVNSGGGLNPVCSAIVTEGLVSGFQQEHLGGLKREFKSRLDHLVGAIQRDLPEAVFSVPEGGYFLWLRFPGVDALELAKVASEEGVGFHPGPAFSSHAGLGEYVRLSLSFYESGSLTEGVTRLARSVARVRKS